MLGLVSLCGAVGTILRRIIDPPSLLRDVTDETERLQTGAGRRIARLCVKKFRFLRRFFCGRSTWKAIEIDGV
jgi:hypothetical protein